MPHNNNNKLVWVTVGKTEHAAWLVERGDERSMVRWISNDEYQWVYNEVIREELLSRRQRLPQPQYKESTEPKSKRKRTIQSTTKRRVSKKMEASKKKTPPKRKRRFLLDENSSSSSSDDDDFVSPPKRPTYYETESEEDDDVPLGSEGDESLPEEALPQEPVERPAARPTNQHRPPPVLLETSEPLSRPRTAAQIVGRSSRRRIARKTIHPQPPPKRPDFAALANDFTKLASPTKE